MENAFWHPDLKDKPKAWKSRTCQNHVRQTTVEFPFKCESIFISRKLFFFVFWWWLAVPFEYLNSSASCNGNHFAVWSLFWSLLCKCGESEAVMFDGWVNHGSSTGHLIGALIYPWLLFFIAHEGSITMLVASSAPSLNEKTLFLWSCLFSLFISRGSSKVTECGTQSFFSKWWGISWFWVFAVPSGRALTCLQNVTRAAKSLKAWRGRYRPNHRRTVPKAFI